MASAGDFFSKLVDDHWVTVPRPFLPFLLLELWSAAGPIGGILEWPRIPALPGAVSACICIADGVGARFSSAPYWSGREWSKRRSNYHEVGHRIKARSLAP